MFISCNMKHYLLIVFIFLISGTLLLSCSENSGDSAPLPIFDSAIDSGIGFVGFFGQTSAWGDFNNDGCQDLFVGNTDSGLLNVFLFKNNCDSTFTDITSESGIIDVPVRSVSWADFDNDGFLDLVVSTIMGGAPPILYKNLDGNFFQDVSAEAGIIVEGGLIGHTIWADYDTDGFVDLFQATAGISVLYQNQGDGTFMDITEISGLGEILFTDSAVWFDFNNDGFQDLFLANDGLNKFYINNGGAELTDITDLAGVNGDINWDSVSACVGDFNNDGFLDLYVGNIGSARNALYRNNGDETFTDVTLEAGTEDIGDARTCTWVDFDSDGLVDLLSTNHINPTMLFRNMGNGKFNDVAHQVSIDFPIDAFSASWADFDLDGFMDVFLNGHLGTVLYRNSGNDNNNVIVELMGNGISSNTAGIGSRVDVTSSFGNQTRVASGGKGCCEQNMIPVHFGVGRNSGVDIFVQWTSGDFCFFEDILVEGGRRFLISQDFCEILEF